MKVRDVMVRNVVAIEPSASLAEAARRMCEANVGILPVVEAGEVLGVITDRDLVVRAIASDVDLVSTPIGRGEATEPREASEFGFRRALITLDGSIAAEAILPAFLRMARPLGMEVVLVRVVVPSARQAPSEDTPVAFENTARMENTARLLEPKKQKADAYLRAVAATPALAGLRVLTTVRTGEAPREIIAAARELQADVIAMSTHGRTGLRRLLFGSVAEAVLRAAHVPVFVLRAAHLQAALFDPVSSSGSTVRGGHGHIYYPR